MPDFVIYKKGALDSQPQVIKFTSCLPIVGGSLRALGLNFHFISIITSDIFIEMSMYGYIHHDHTHFLIGGFVNI
jgi:hypothetical protein